MSQLSYPIWSLGTSSFLHLHYLSACFPLCGSQMVNMCFTHTNSILICFHLVWLKILDQWLSLWGEFKAKWTKHTEPGLGPQKSRFIDMGDNLGMGLGYFSNFSGNWGKNLCPRCYSWYLPLGLGSNEPGFCLFLCFPQIPCFPGQSLPPTVT